jgi:hypothetical protein
MCSAFEEVVVLCLIPEGEWMTSMNLTSAHIFVMLRF